MADTDPTTVACPMCGAPVGTPCQTFRGIAVNHNARIYETEVEDYAAEVRAERSEP